MNFIFPMVNICLSFHLTTFALNFLLFIFIFIIIIIITITVTTTTMIIYKFDYFHYSFFDYLNALFLFISPIIQ
jgi:hypothetical protein